MHLKTIMQLKMLFSTAQQTNRSCRSTPRLQVRSLPTPWMPTAPKRAGFTLLELLVSVGIIAVLTGMLLPALARSTVEAGSATCKGNLRQIGLALAMYVDDHGRYPSNAEWGGSAFPWYWDQRLLPYAGRSSGVFSCPSKRSNRQPFSRFSYGINSHGSGRLDGPNLGLGQARFERIAPSQVKHPSDMIAVGDNGHGTMSDWLLNPNLDFNGPDPGFVTWLPATRHRKGANIVFVDAHVEYAAQSHWIQNSTDARRRWNNDNEPHPEVWK